MPRPTTTSTGYVYRLDIDYPADVDWLHPPDEWVCDMQDWGSEERQFYWPPERRFLSKKGAESRAERLRRYGCVVSIQRAEVGEWATV